MRKEKTKKAIKTPTICKQAYLKKDNDYDKNVARSIALTMADAAMTYRTENYFVETKAHKITEAKFAETKAQRKLRDDVEKEHPELTSFEERFSYIVKNYIRLVIRISAYDKKDLLEVVGGH